VWAATTLLLMTAGQVDPLPTAADAINAAYVDMQRQPPELRPYLRYLSMHNLTKEERAAAIPVIAGHVQHLSRASDITRPGVLADGMLLRVNLQDYGWATEVWERLQDPYSLATVEVIKEVPWGYYDSRGVWYQTRVEKKAVKQLAPAPWLSEAPCSPEKVAQMVEWTGSRLPVTEGRWFFNATATAEGGRFYYQFLGIKTVADVEKMIGFNRKEVEAIRVELREAVAISGVTTQPRAIARWDSLTGPYWRTFDMRKALKEKNPLQVLGRDIEKVKDGSEGYFTLANEFWGTYGADAKDDLVDAVPGDIATDHAAKGNYKQVIPGVGCMRCHPPGGLQPIDGWVRNLLNPPLELRTKDYEEARRLRAQYLRKLEGPLARDQQRYIEAVKEATGMDAKTYQAKYVAFYEAYEDRNVTAAHAARDMGLPVVEFKRRLLLAIKSGEYVSPLASSLVHEGPRARPIPIRQYEEIVSELYDVMKRTEKVK
jgi:hypothetical protein